MTSEQVQEPRMYDNYVDPNSAKYKQANPKNLHLLPYDEYDVKGEYIGANSTETYTTGEEIEFWLHESDYQHAEMVH